MTALFNAECPKCKISHEQYDKLLAFVKMFAKERPDNDPIYKYINEAANDLLIEIGESVVQGSEHCALKSQI